MGDNCLTTGEFINNISIERCWKSQSALFAKKRTLSINISRWNILEFIRKFNKLRAYLLSLQSSYGNNIPVWLFDNLLVFNLLAYLLFLAPYLWYCFNVQIDISRTSKWFSVTFTQTSIAVNKAVFHVFNDYIFVIQAELVATKPPNISVSQNMYITSSVHLTVRLLLAIILH